MAPTVKARCFSVHVCFMFVVLVASLFATNTKALLVYERQALFDIWTSFVRISHVESGKQVSTLPPFLATVPDELRCCEPFYLPRRISRRRRKRRGIRSGIHARNARNAWVKRTNTGLHPIFGVCANNADLACRQRYIQPVYPASLEPVQWLQRPSWTWGRRRKGTGACLDNLRVLDCAVLPADEEVKVHMALLNVRSLSNKTYVLRDFYNSNALDFMFLTETWMHSGDLAPLRELCPPDTSFFSSPRLTGRGGGVASLFNDSFQCKQVLDGAAFASFELQLFTINNPVILLAVIYRPPKHNNNFISEFADFLSRFILQYDKILIVGDFNIHICCGDKPLVNDFLNVIEFFNLTQFVSGPTHQRGHTLDLVLGYGVSVLINEISALPTLDHLPIVFDVLLPTLHSSGSGRKPQETRSSRYISPQALIDLNLRLPDAVDLVFNQTSSMDCLTESFNGTLQGLLDSVAPVKIRKCRQKSHTPWLNDDLLILRKNCRKIERQWRCSRLQVHFQMWHDALTTYQSRMSAAKAAYYSNVITDNKHNPRLLFDTVAKITQGHRQTVITDLSAHDFLNYFDDRVEVIRSSIPQPLGGSDYTATTCGTCACTQGVCDASVQ